LVQAKAAQREINCFVKFEWRNYGRRLAFVEEIPAKQPFFAFSPMSVSDFPPEETRIRMGEIHFPLGETRFPMGKSQFPSEEIRFRSGETHFPPGKIGSHLCYFQTRCGRFRPRMNICRSHVSDKRLPARVCSGFSDEFPN
jgi:hypothetical protein